MKEHNSLLTLLPWLLIAFLVVVSIAPYLGSQQVEVSQHAISSEDSVSDIISGKKAEPGELSDLDELVGK
jgi:hypothetical protein